MKEIEDEIVESMKTYERARQETAREILKIIETYGNYKSTDYIIEIIKDIYGIELE